MKFAKELEADLVPEWRAKYLDYKQGKKKLKAVARALRNIERSPLIGGRRDASPTAAFSQQQAPFYAYLNRPTSRLNDRRASSGDVGASGTDVAALRGSRASPGVPIPGAEQDPERVPLQQVNDGRHLTRYGSIVGSPPDPQSTSAANRRSHDGAFLKLPGPALSSPAPQHAPQQGRRESSGSAYTIGENNPRPSNGAFQLPSKYRSVFQPKRVNSMPGTQDGQLTRPLAKRMFSGLRGSTHESGTEDIAMHAYREVDVRQTEFFMFLDKEMEKVEDFYKLKEDESTERLKVLREQLHILRDQRMEEILYATAGAKRPSHATTDANQPPTNATTSRNSTAGAEDSQLINKGNGNSKGGWYNPAKYSKKLGPSSGKTFEAMKELGTPHGLRPVDGNRDYVRRKPTSDVPYRTAKRKLKIALAEYYRGLELLKSYALLNRTAFRKINKKFDKTVNARPSGRYMSEKVNTAYFVKSAVLEGHIQAVEDLYARYFERGSHKIAVNKLRAKVARAGDYTGSVFRNGVLLATGSVFGIEGVVYGTALLHHHDPVIASHTGYLLQIYGGYFLMLFLTLLFCGACRVWSSNKVNYSFIFEFDTRHSLDWRQLSEIPSLLGFFFGLTMWLNFKRFANDSFYIYWPCVLIGISAFILFNPLPTFYHRSRGWFLYSTWRLSLAGVYPVEFRDFFLGDMFCSLTYALGNIELFFCLYANYWNNPAQCNSSHSRLLGFFAALPGVWRALQCLRRYHDTRNWFPHLANFGKYMCTILYYMTLSLYRINHTSEMRIIFIVFATVNAIYCSAWDIIMDWSLGDFTAKHPFLRTTLGFKYAWWYYAAIVIDPIIRFNWIFYAIYAHDTQHSTIVSFMVGFTEVLRRGMWQLFRVENEHCTNVGRFRASRDIPLPYETAKEHEERDEVQSEGPQDEESQQNVPTSAATGVDADRRKWTASGQSAAMRLRKTSMAGNKKQSPMIRAITRVGTLLHAAHAQDFERRRKSDLPQTNGELDEDDEDSEDEQDGTIGQEERDGTHERRQSRREAATNGREAEESGEGERSNSDEADVADVASVRELRRTAGS